MVTYLRCQMTPYSLLLDFTTIIGYYLPCAKSAATPVSRFSIRSTISGTLVDNVPVEKRLAVISL